VAALLIAQLSNSAQAQSSSEGTFSTSISPVTFELTAKPGDTLKNVVKVTNVSTLTLQYTMQVEAFVGNELGQATIVPNKDDADPALALDDWTTVSPSSFTLKPKEQQIVSYTIVIPKNAEPGGRYGSVLAAAKALDTNELAGTGAKVGQKVGSLVLLSIQGPINYVASIKDFTPTKQLFEHTPITINTRIHNQSTVHIKPKGFITLTNLFGKKVVQIPFEERNVLPDGDRLLTTEIKDNLPIGRYTANLALVYGDKNAQLISSTSFIVFPWKVGVPVLIGAIVLLWVIIAGRRRIGSALRILVGRQ
jgi:hypothetical protein